MIFNVHDIWFGFTVKQYSLSHTAPNKKDDIRMKSVVTNFKSTPRVKTIFPAGTKSCTHYRFRLFKPI